MFVCRMLRYNRAYFSLLQEVFMPSITKAIIPVAGLGTRMLPATKAIPKEMLPLIDKPLIQYVVSEAVEAGIKEIILVTHASKNAIENHFDKSFELEAQLEKRLKRQLLNEVRSITPKGVTIISVRQAEAKGLGHAVASARPVVGDSPCIVMLPDVLVDQYYSNLAVDNLAAMVKNFEATGASQIMVEPVAWEDVDQYGVVDCSGVELGSGETAKIESMVEKPEMRVAPSNMAVVGRYVLSASIWDLLENTKPGAGGEIQLTDAISDLLKTEQVDAYHVIGKSHDCGSKLGFMLATMEYSFKHKEIGPNMRSRLEELLGRQKPR